MLHKAESQYTLAVKFTHSYNKHFFHFHIQTYTRGQLQFSIPILAMDLFLGASRVHPLASAIEKRSSNRAEWQ